MVAAPYAYPRTLSGLFRHALRLTPCGAHCPNATTTSVYGFEEEFPGLEFGFPSLWAVAFQKQDTLAGARAADGWEVKGCNAVLPVASQPVHHGPRWRAFTG